MDAAATTTTANNLPRPAAEAVRPRLPAGRFKELAADDAFFAPSRAGEPDGDLTFGDVLDVINPLQHIPVVSTVYRAVTGDTIKPTARVMGGMLYGGPVGAAFAAASAVVEDVAGEDPGAGIMTALGLGREAPVPSTAVAGAVAAPSGLIAEATTRPAVPAAAPAATVAAAPVPAKPAALAANMPQLSPAAFDALMRSVGATPEAAAAPETAAAPAATTAAAGSTEDLRFFPARHVGAKPARAVPMDIRPQDNGNYEAALRMMRENIERYQGAGAAALPAP